MREQGDRNKVTEHLICEPLPRIKDAVRTTGLTTENTEITEERNRVKDMMTHPLHWNAQGKASCGLRPPGPSGLSLPTCQTPLAGQAYAFGDEHEPLPAAPD